MSRRGLHRLLVASVLAACPGLAHATPTTSDSLRAPSFNFFNPPPAYEMGTTGRPAQAGDVAHFRDGLRALGKGDLKAADDNFQAAAKAAPKAPGPLIGLAEVARRRGDTASAEGDLKKALKLAPNDAFVHSAWGHYLASEHDYLAALAEFEKAAKLAPRWSTPRDQAGDIYLGVLHDPEKAAAAYRSSLALHPDDAGARYALGNALLAIGKPNEAKAELVEAAKLAPRSPWSWVALGEAEARLGNGHAALAAYDRALKVKADLPEANIGRGDVYAATGQPEKAIEAYQAALKVAPRALPVLDRLATTEDNAGHRSEAEKHYRAALEINPKDPIATNNLAFLLANQRRDLDEALRLATSGVSANPNSPTALDTLAWVQRARGDLAAAEKILVPLSADTKDPTVLYHLGVVYAEMGKRRDAIVALDRALKIDPNLGVARGELEKLSSSQGR